MKCMRCAPLVDAAMMTFLSMLLTSTAISAKRGAPSVHASRPACFLLAFQILQIANLHQPALPACYTRT